MAELPTVVQRKGAKKGIWSLRFWVPDHLRGPGEPREIWQSLRTTDKGEAMKSAIAAQEAIVARLTAELTGRAPQNEKQYLEAVIAFAKSRGFTYRPAADLATVSDEEIVARLESARAEDPTGSRMPVVDALLGGVSVPQLLISELPAFYERERRTQNAGRNAEEMRKWRNPFLLAASSLIDLVGDKPVATITRKDGRALEEWWKDRIADGEVLDETANKGVGFLRIMLKAHDRAHEIERVNPFEGIRLEGGVRVSRKRLEFSEAWIRENLLSDAPMPGLNEEARDILIIMAETGCSPSEISGLLPKHIHLGAPIPFFELLNEGRRLKNRHRVRSVVVVRRALEAMKRHPDGFPRYRGSPVFSDTVNKYMRENRMLPTEDHSAYSLRHSFEGRMKRAKIDGRYRAEMMGHSVKSTTGREVYGDLMTLEEKLAIMTAIAISPWSPDGPPGAP